AAIGTSPRRIILGFMVATRFLSMWVSNTAATMMMIPVGLAVVYQASLSMRGGEHESDLGKFEMSIVFGIGYAATLGGLAKLTGSLPLAVIPAIVGRIFGVGTGFGSWMMFGVPIVVKPLPLARIYLTSIKFQVGYIQLSGGVESFRDEKMALGR